PRGRRPFGRLDKDAAEQVSFALCPRTGRIGEATWCSTVWPARRVLVVAVVAAVADGPAPATRGSAPPGTRPTTHPRTHDDAHEHRPAARTRRRPGPHPLRAPHPGPPRQRPAHPRPARGPRPHGGGAG